MSVGSHIGIQIRLMIHLVKAIVELGMEYKELKSMKTQDGKIHKVDLVVKDTNGRNIGFQKTEKGEYKIIADCAGLSAAELKKQKDAINKIRQKYAYNVVLDQLKKQGYVIAEEEKVKDNTIRLVARKWS